MKLEGGRCSCCRFTPYVACGKTNLFGSADHVQFCVVVGECRGEFVGEFGSIKLTSFQSTVSLFALRRVLVNDVRHCGGSEIVAKGVVRSVLSLPIAPVSFLFQLSFCFRRTLFSKISLSKISSRLYRDTPPSLKKSSEGVCSPATKNA